jgi:hypothetical protein
LEDEFADRSPRELGLEPQDIEKDPENNSNIEEEKKDAPTSTPTPSERKEINPNLIK